MTVKSPFRRWKARREYKKRLDGLVPQDPPSWDDVIESLPVIEI